MKSNIIKEFNLPGYIKGKSFAEASKKIEKKFKDRNDSYSLNTKEELLKRLAEAQEYVKMQEAIANNAEEVPDMMEGQIPEGMEEFMSPEQQMEPQAEGEAMQPEMQQQMQPEMQPQMQPGMEGANIMKAGGMMDSMGGGTPGMDDVNTALQFGENIFGSGNTQSREQENLGSSALGGGMQGAQTGMKFGGPKGALIGAGVGAIGGIIGGNKRNKQAAQNLTNDDMSFALDNRNLFSKGGNMYNTGGPVDPPTKHTGNVNTGKLIWGESIDSPTEHTGNVSTGKLTWGGDSETMKEFKKGKFLPGYSLTNSSINKTSNDNIKNAGQTSLSNNNNNNTGNSGKISLSNKELNTSSTKPKQREKATTVSSLTGSSKPTMGKYVSNPTENIETNLGQTGKNELRSLESNPTESNIQDFIKKHGPDALRLSPVISNLIARKNLERGANPRRERLGQRFERDLFDEQSMTNQVNQNNVNRALSEASGGDLGGLRSSILAANLNKDKAISEANIKGQNINRQQNQVAQQFDQNVDRTNIQQSNLDTADAMANEGAYQTAKQNLNAAIATDLGSIGKELQDRGMAEKLFGYTSKGDYVVNDKGEKLSHEEHAKQIGVEFKNGKYIINGKEISPEDLDKAKKSLFKNGGMGKSLGASNQTGTIV